jgi:transketolase
LAVVRPADANETAIAWREAITRRKPVGLVLSRQNLPVLDRTRYSSAEGVSDGAYIVSNCPGVPDVIVIATGSEVSLAISAQTLLLQEGINARVVSAPCLEWFSEKSEDYKETVLPSQVKARVSIEAGVTAGWHEYVGDAGVVIGINHFGASASAATLFNEFGFTVEAVVHAAKTSIAKAGK